MKVYSKRKQDAQSSIEFSLAFICAILFLVISCNLFVWFNHSMVTRQRDYEDTRVTAASDEDPGKQDFYVHKEELNMFTLGGYKK